MGYTWLGMQKLTWEEVLQRHEKGELAGCFRLYGDNSEAMIDRGYDFAGDILALSGNLFHLRQAIGSRASFGVRYRWQRTERKGWIESTGMQ